MGRLGWAATGGVYLLALNLGGLPVWPLFGGKLYLLEGLVGVAPLVGAALVGASVVGVYYYASVAGGFLWGGPHRGAPTTTPTVGVVVGALVGTPLVLLTEVTTPNVA